MSYGFVFRDGPDFYVAVQDQDFYFTEPTKLQSLESDFNDIDDKTAVLTNVEVVQSDDIMFSFELLEKLEMNCRVQDAVQKLGSDHLFTRCMMLSLMRHQQSDDDDDPESDCLSA